MVRRYQTEELLHAACHDMQESLRGVAGYCEILELEFADQLGASGCSYAKSANRGARRMQKLVRDLMVYTSCSLESVTMVDCDLNDIVARSLAELSNEVPGREVDIEVGLLPQVAGDAIMLERLFRNLISNGIRFAQPGKLPKIRITSSVSNTHAHIAVMDHGIGIESIDADRIFEPFCRLHSRDIYEGSGLGLAIGQRIAELHQGDISFTSSRGEGSVFVVSFPLP